MRAGVINTVLWTPWETNLVKEFDMHQKGKYWPIYIESSVPHQQRPRMEKVELSEWNSYSVVPRHLPVHWSPAKSKNMMRNLE